jgi:hypothetical protein
MSKAAQAKQQENARVTTLVSITKETQTEKVEASGTDAKPQKWSYIKSLHEHIGLEGSPLR